MIKTWLMRRSVRSPPALAVTARIISSVCRLPFIKTSPLPAWISSTPRVAAAASVGAVSTISQSEISSWCRAATSLILAAGPTSVAWMIPASADLIAPRSELSSQGYTTTVDTVGDALGDCDQTVIFRPGLRGTCACWHGTHRFAPCVRSRYAHSLECVMPGR